MAEVSLETRLGDVILKNPVVTASGTFGYGKEYADLVPLEKLGGITVKGVSPFPSHGNTPPRTGEVFAGLINSIGLQNPGLDRFMNHEDYLPFLRTVDTAVFINIWGRTIDDYVAVAAALDSESEGIAALEINISCPNIKEGGSSFGTNLTLAGKVVEAVRNATSLPLITKLSPNVTHVADFARCVVDHGSDMISVINTYPAMSIDINTRRPCVSTVAGGLSGHAIKPIAVKIVYDVARAVDVPIIGMGGIYSAEDAIEFMLAGADAVAIGTALFSDPGTPLDVIAGIKTYLESWGINDVADIVGTVLTV